MLLCLICLLITKAVVNLDYKDNDSNELSTTSVLDTEESGLSKVLISPPTQSIDPQNYENKQRQCSICH
ncbi:40523_t:CDS:2 [Gigaspora margarita]|uniref:40523_t:CDS:1 n=1 Tax=Gigaspora margarita TaxID=4874 RepID=A0ABN7VJU0_GIGMA|nr:40523_t:CDS:2 [Gigaspora margarita]